MSPAFQNFPDITVQPLKMSLTKPCSKLDKGSRPCEGQSADSRTQPPGSDVGLASPLLGVPLPRAGCSASSAARRVTVGVGWCTCVCGGQRLAGVWQCSVHIGCHCPLSSGVSGAPCVWRHMRVKDRSEVPYSDVLALPEWRERLACFFLQIHNNLVICHC